MKQRLFGMLLLVALCVLTLTGCKKDVGTPEDNAIHSHTNKEEALTYTFGYSCITMENPYFVTLEEAIREQLENEGNTLITRDPALDAQLQIEQIQDMIEQGIDAIFLTPVDWQAIQPAIDALKEANVKIINIDTQVSAIESVDSYIGTDNKTAGFICGQDLIEKHPNGGKIIILECPTMNSINDRITGFEQAIVEQGFEVVARADVQGDLEKSLSITTELLGKHPDITAIMCGNDPSALGALVAANTANRKDMVIYGIDGSPDLKKELIKKDTLIAGTAAQSPINIGKTAVEVALKILNGEDYEKEIYEETFLINQENVDMYGVDGWQ